MWTVLGVLGVLAFWLQGCASREHIREDFGKSTRGAFEAQRINATPAVGQPRGLDSEEASLINARYVQIIAPKDMAKSQDEPARVLVVEEHKDGKRR